MFWDHLDTRRLARALGVKIPEPDPFVSQAKKDQKTADYPYCREGSVCCVALCECKDTIFSRRKFVEARTQLLREGRGNHRPDFGNIPSFRSHRDG